MKKYPIILSGILILLFASLFAAKKYVDTLLSPVNLEREAARVLNITLKLDSSPDWKLFPPEISFRNLSLRKDMTGLKCELKIAKGKVSINPWSLIGKKLVFEELTLDDPDLSLSTVSSSPLPVNENMYRQKHGEAQAAPNPPDFLLKRFLVRQGSINILTTTAYYINNLDILAENIQPDAEAKLKSGFTISNSNAPDDTSSSTSLNIALEALLKFSSSLISLNNASLELTPAEKTESSPINISLDCSLKTDNGDIKLSNATISQQNINLNIQGTGNLKKFNLAGNLFLEITKSDPDPYTDKNFNLTAESPFKLDKDSISFPTTNLSILKNEGMGEFHIFFPDSAHPWRLVGTLDFERIVMPDETSAKPKDTSSDIKNGELASSFNKSFWPELSLNIQCGFFKWKKIGFSNIRLPITGENGEYATQNATFDWANGNVSAQFSTNFNSGTTELNIDGRNLNIGNALSELSIPGITGGNGNLRSHIVMQGIKWTQIERTLNGNVEIYGRNAEIGIMEEVAGFLPLPHRLKQDLPTEVSQIRINCAIDRGVAYCRPIHLSTGILNLEGMASVDLPSSHVDGHIMIDTGKAKLPILFSGSPDNIAWRPGSGFMQELRKFLP